MKKLFLSIGVATLLAGATGCSAKVSDSQKNEKQLGDSISLVYGQIMGANFSEGLERQKVMNPEQPDINVDKFMKGLISVLKADTTDNLSYLRGQMEALQRVIGMELEMSQLDVPFNSELFLKGYKEGMNGDASANRQTEMMQLQSRLRVIQTTKEEERLRSESEKNEKAAVAFIDSLKTANPQVVTSDSGLSYIIENPGEAPKVTSTDKVKVKYKGSLINGKVFDENEEGVEFTVGGVVKGFGEGLQLLGKGGKATLYIPGNLGYGMSGQPRAGIGPNDMLVFDVEILDVIPAE